MSKKYIIWEKNSKKEGIVGNIHIDNFVPACHKGKICFSKDRNLSIGIAEVTGADERENVNILQSIHKVGTMPQIEEFLKVAERGLLSSAASVYGLMRDSQFSTIKCDDIEGILYQGYLYTSVDGVVVIFEDFEEYNISFTETGCFSMLNAVLSKTEVHTVPDLDILLSRVSKYGFELDDMVNMVSGINGTGIIIDDELFIEVEHRCYVIEDIKHREAYWQNDADPMTLRDYACYSQFGVMWEDLKEKYTFDDGYHFVKKHYRPADGFAYLHKAVYDMLMDYTIYAYVLNLGNKECITAHFDTTDIFKSIGKYTIDDLNEAQEWMNKKNEDFDIHYKAAIKKGLIRPTRL